MPDTKEIFTVAANDAPVVQDARKLAEALHAHQTDHSGKPYIGHPARVVQNLLTIFPNAHQDIIMAAWLHDTIEDCRIGDNFLRQKGYSENCIAMIMAVSKPENDEREYAQVIDDLIATGNTGAILIKIADNMDNLHPERVAALTAVNPEKAERLGNRYRNSIAKLSRAIGLNLNSVLISIKNAPKLLP